MPCLLGVITYLVHSLAELMPSSSVHTDVGWLASSLPLMISFTVLPLHGLFKKMRHSTHCLNHLLPPIKSTDYRMFCVTVASPTSCLIVTISSISTPLLTGVFLARFQLTCFFVYFFVFVFCAHVCCATLKVIVLYCILLLAFLSSLW